MTRSPVIRFPAQLRRADQAALRRLEAEDSQIVGTRTGPEGGVMVRCQSGEVYQLEAFRAKRQRPQFDPTLPPASSAALKVAA